MEASQFHRQKTGSFFVGVQGVRVDLRSALAGAGRPAVNERATTLESKGYSRMEPDAPDPPNQPLKALRPGGLMKCMGTILRKYTSFDEMKADEYRYWQSRPVHERIDAVEEMIRTAYALKGWEIEPDVPRLQRPFVRLQCPWR